MTIENSFGRLKGRWRCLQRRLDVDIEFACTAIAACVVLHNMCELHNELFNDEWNDNANTDDADYDVQADDDDTNAAELLCAKILRDDIVNDIA